MNQRVLWVDYAKAIGIILVVYGHVTRGLNKSGLLLDSSFYQFLDSVIYTFHMPLFFFLTGLFFVDQLNALKNSGLITNKLKTLMYPYVVWSLLQGLIEVILSRYTNGDVTITKVLSFMVEPRAQFWFLYTLFFINLVCIFIYSAINEKAFFLILVSGALFVGGQYIFHITLGLTYTIGGISVLILAVISISLVVSVSIWLSTLSIGWLAFIGMSSMSIYLMHIIIGSGVRVVLHKFFGIESTVVHAIIGILAALSIPLLAQALIKRYKFNFLLKFPL